MLLLLNCASIGRATVKSILIDEGKTVDFLKNEINLPKRACDARNEDKVKLFLANKDGSWLDFCSEDVEKLKSGEKTALIEALTREELELPRNSNIRTLLMNMPPPSMSQIHVLVIPKQKLSASPISTGFRPHPEGICMDLPHLPRDELVERLYNAVMEATFVVLTSPAGSEILEK
ncbi:Crinkler (CRN) family protein [Phytophthora palmivora]|uniref:Crinkler (CRN) family protein n=1 Tax=Phytophthora palmivora TaxID=4796 RepID=A0A2P4YF97_9STRA|nr:Crinkler (CRN) family protein [Phytophthora palmivora]